MNEELAMTKRQADRLRELKSLEYDGIRLDDCEAREYRDLLNIESAVDWAEHDRGLDALGKRPKGERG